MVLLLHCMYFASVHGVHRCFVNRNPKMHRIRGFSSLFNQVLKGNGLTLTPSSTAVATSKVNNSRHFHSSDIRRSDNDSEDNHVIVKVENGLRQIILNRPDKKNAVTMAMGKALIMALLEGNSDDDTNIIVVTGTGDYFTSGMDISGFKPSTPDNAPKEEDKDKKKRGGLKIFAKAFIDCDKPLIALVNGPAHGFAVTMLGLFDMVYCSDKAYFQTRFTEWGLPPELASTYTFPRIMGYAKASNMLLFNNKLTAQEALECGLVARVFPHEEFQNVSLAKVKMYANLPKNSLMYSKALIRGRERDLLWNVHKNEQDQFDPEVAREVKRKFAMKALKH